MLVAGLLSVALAGCASTIDGQAVAAKGLKTGLAAVPPCELIAKQWLPALSLSPGKPSPAKPEQLIPGGCRWEPDDDMITDGSVSVLVSSDISLQEFTGGADYDDELELGGIKWHVSTGAGGIGGDCGLTAIISDKSWVYVNSANYSDDSKACDKAKEAAPLVAGKLPGGDPVGEPPPPDKSPVADVHACDLLAASQAKKLGYKPAGEKSSANDNGCTWWPVKERADFKDIVLIVDPKRALTTQFSQTPDAKKKLGGREWLVFDAPGGSLGSCYVGLATSKKSHVRLYSRNDKQKREACKQALRMAPSVAKNIPAG